MKSTYLHGAKGSVEMKSKRLQIFFGLFLSAVLVMGMASCGERTAAVDDVIVSEDMVKETEIYGKVTAISVKDMTIALADEPEKTKETTSGGAGQEITLTGEKQTVTVTEDSVCEVNGETAAFSDIQPEDIVTVMLKGNTVVSITKTEEKAVLSALQNENKSSILVETKAVNTVKDEQEWSDDTYESTEKDVSAITVLSGGSLTLKNGEIKKSGDASDKKSSKACGRNAAFLVRNGGNAVISDTSIETTGDAASGLKATYGGSITGDTVSVTTKGADSQALSTGDGGGTVDVVNGTFYTEGTDSPCIYSAGEVTITDSTGQAENSGLAVIEGENSVTLTGSKLTGAGTGSMQTDSMQTDSTQAESTQEDADNIYDAGVMIYQNVSEEEKKGTAIFSALDSTLTVSEQSQKYETLPLFFVTNSDAVINLENTEVNYGSGILLHAAGNDGEWGEEGFNGANVELNARNETLSGDIVLDKLSSVAVNLKSSMLEGCVDKINSGNVTMLLDRDSTWNVTDDSYVFILTNEDQACSNIVSNGHTVYYDSTNSANDWLNGRTVTLTGGGTLEPAP